MLVCLISSWRIRGISTKLVRMKRYMCLIAISHKFFSIGLVGNKIIENHWNEVSWSQGYAGHHVLRLSSVFFFHPNPHIQLPFTQNLVHCQACGVTEVTAERLHWFNFLCKSNKWSQLEVASVCKSESKKWNWNGCWNATCITDDQFVARILLDPFQRKHTLIWFVWIWPGVCNRTRYGVFAMINLRKHFHKLSVTTAACVGGVVT